MLLKRVSFLHFFENAKLVTGINNILPSLEYPMIQKLTLYMEAMLYLAIKL